MNRPGRATFEQLNSELLRDPISGDPMSFEGDGFRSGGRFYPVSRGVGRFGANDGESVIYDDTLIQLLSQVTSQTSRFETTVEDRFSEYSDLLAEDISGKLILEVGCGTGAFTALLAERNASVIGIEPRPIVELAADVLRNSERVWFIQSDFMTLPFRKESFDIVLALGSLAQTVDPYSAFVKLTRFLKPGGTISVWLPPDEPTDIAIGAWCPFVNALPQRMLIEWFTWIVTHANLRPENPVLAYLRKVFPLWIGSGDMHIDVARTIEPYVSRRRTTHSPEEVAGWFSKAGLVSVRHAGRRDTSISGVRPRR